MSALGYTHGAKRFTFYQTPSTGHMAVPQGHAGDTSNAKPVAHASSHGRPIPASQLPNKVTAAGNKNQEKINALVFSSMDDSVVMSDGKPVIRTSDRMQSENVTIERMQRRMRVTIKVKSPVARKLLGLPPLKVSR